MTGVVLPRPSKAPPRRHASRRRRSDHRWRTASPSGSRARTGQWSPGSREASQRPAWSGLQATASASCKRERDHERANRNPGSRTHEAPGARGVTPRSFRCRRAACVPRHLGSGRERALVGGPTGVKVLGGFREVNGRACPPRRREAAAQPPPGPGRGRSAVPVLGDRAGPFPVDLGRGRRHGGNPSTMRLYIENPAAIRTASWTSGSDAPAALAASTSPAVSSSGLRRTVPAM